MAVLSQHCDARVAVLAGKAGDCNDEGVDLPGERVWRAGPRGCALLLHSPAGDRVEDAAAGRGPRDDNGVLECSGAGGAAPRVQG
eukprot:115018-Rhodomonas_salina.1